MARLFYAVVLALAILVAGCNPGGDIQLTLVSENVALNTQIAEIRSTATYAADLLNQTAEYIGTAIVQGNNENQLLSITLAASGISASDVTPGAPVPTFSAANPNPQTTSGVTPVIQGTAPITQDSALVTTTPAAAPSLYNVVTAAGVGSNDCALSSVSTFSSSTEQIYVVATAANIPPNTRLTSQWYMEGTPIVTHDFTPDFAIQQNCIWFYIDQTDTAFTPGNWSVQLNINDVPAAPPVAFTISG